MITPVLIQVSPSTLTLEFIVILVILLSLLPTLFLLFMMVTRRRRASRGLGDHLPYDTSIVTRLVKFKSSGEEYLVTGNAKDTFRMTCLDDWQFQGIDKDEPWHVVDDRGNDISQMALESYDGLCEIVLPIGYESI